MSKMACTTVETFYRVCGHTVTGIRHCQPCLIARGDESCWNPLENHTVYYYLPYEFHPIGEGAYIRNPGIHSPDEMRFYAYRARIIQIHFEKCTRAQAREKLQQEELERLQRNQDWYYAHRKFFSNPINIEAGLPYILDLKDKDRAPSNLVAEAHPPFDDVCSICLDSLEKESEDKQNLARKLSCNHHFHHDCIVNWLGFGMSDPNAPGTDVDIFAGVGDIRCPKCRSDCGPIVFKSDGEEPIYRWYPAEKRYWQVGGHIAFPSYGGCRKAVFKTGQKPDRWGDEL
ncbi:hypothetical protein DL98DRAFT_525605 [Cadophora sp. DSE1049]|nr:hypothetical protein DL98DRAFT_525605 [Cadophora sp. DSE1049]